MSAEPQKRGKNEIAREQLEPLREGERPWVVVLCAVLALMIAIANLVAAALLVADGRVSTALGAATFGVVMLVVARALWTLSYLAVLGFQALLVVVMMFTFLRLILVSDVAGLLAGLGLLAFAGTLFWFMVKAMARIQMP